MRITQASHKKTMQFPPNFEERIFIMAKNPRLTNFGMHKYLRMRREYDKVHSEQNTEPYTSLYKKKHMCDFFETQGCLIDKFDPILIELYREYGDLIEVSFSHAWLVSVPQCFKEHCIEYVKIDTNLYKLDIINVIVNDTDLNDAEKIHRIKEITQTQICDECIETVEVNKVTLRKMLLMIIDCDMLTHHEKITDIYNLLSKFCFESEEHIINYYDDATDDEKIDLAIYKKINKIKREHKEYDYNAPENFERCTELLKIMKNILTNKF